MSATSRLKLLTGTAVGALVGAPAFAADLPPAPEPFVASTPDWTGFFVSAGVSLNGMRSDLHGFGYDNQIKGVTLRDSVRDDDYGFGGVLELGYDHQIGENFVIGVSVDGNWIFDGLASSGFVETPFSGKIITGQGELDYFGEVEGVISLVGRAGILVTPKTLVYGLGGVAWVKYDIGGNFSSRPGIGEPLDISWADDGWETGYSVGVGLETFLGQGSNTTFKFEYRFTDVDAISTGVEECPDACIGGWTKFDPELHSFIAKLSYRF